MDCRTITNAQLQQELGTGSSEIANTVVEDLVVLTRIENNVKFEKCVFKKGFQLEKSFFNRFKLEFKSCDFRFFNALGVRELATELHFVSSNFGMFSEEEDKNHLQSFNISNCIFKNKLTVIGGSISFGKIYNSTFLEGSIYLSSEFIAPIPTIAFQFSNNVVKVPCSIFVDKIITRSDENMQSYAKENHKSGFYVSACRFNERLSFDFSSGEIFSIINCIMQGNTSIRNRTIIEEKKQYHIDQFNVFESTFKGILFFDSVKIERLSLLNVITDVPIMSRSLDVSSSNSTTYRTLKKAASELNDQNSYLKYRQLEFTEILKEKFQTLNTIFKESGFRSFLFALGDLAILALNRISNNHGTCWRTAFAFTMLTSFLLFNLLVFLGSSNLSIGWSISGFEYISNNYLDHFWSFFNPSHSVELIKKTGLDNNFFTGMIDTVLRIFVLYGTFQFVQAFRKFNLK